MSTESPRKIIPATLITQAPEADRLIADILNIFQNEIAQIANKSRKGIQAGKSLEAGDARILQGYAKMLVELSKEDRERKKSDDGVGSLTNEQLVEAMKLIMDASGNKTADETK